MRRKNNSKSKVEIRQKEIEPETLSKQNKLIEIEQSVIQSSNNDLFNDELSYEDEKENINIPVTANTPYNLFFRKLREMSLFWLQYKQSKLKYPNLLVVGFDPYFAMMCVRPNTKVTFVIHELPVFEQPFSIDLRGKSNEHIANICRGIIRNSSLLKKIVKFGKDIYEKHLYIDKDDILNKNVQFYFGHFRDLKGKLNPSTVINLTPVEVSVENIIKKNSTKVFTMKRKENIEQALVESLDMALNTTYNNINRNIDNQEITTSVEISKQFNRK